MAIKKWIGDGCSFSFFNLMGEQTTEIAIDAVVVDKKRQLFGDDFDLGFALVRWNFRY